MLFEVLSDLDRAGTQLLRGRWGQIPDESRLQLIRRMGEDAEDNIERSYGRVMRIALNDTNPSMRQAALEGIWEFDAPGLLEELIEMASSETDEGVRVALAVAFTPYCQRAASGQIDDVQVTQIRETLLDMYQHDPSPLVRRRAIETVAFMAGSEEITDAIRDAYESGQYDMIVSSLRAMGHTAMDYWLPICHRELLSDEPEIRYEAVTAVGSIMNERSSGHVVDMLSDEDTEVRLAAIGALGSIGGSISIGTLRRIVQEEDDELLLEAAQEALEEASLVENPLRPPF